MNPQPDPSQTIPTLQTLQTVLVTGGAGYVGAALVPRLLERGHRVRVLDLFLFGERPLEGFRGHPGLETICGDLRDASTVKSAVSGCDAVIHLACISNDPSFELDPDLGRSINYNAFGPLVRISKDEGVRRFIYASSSSVYGVSESGNVTEDHPLRPITAYSRYKSLCEPILLKEQASDFTTVVIRPATVCGHSPRQRLDLIVNILTNHAVNNGTIKIFGGNQLRPSIHIDDMVELYALLLQLPDEKIAGKIFNAGHQNNSVREIAGIVQTTVEREVPGRECVRLASVPTDDQRSYHISSRKIKEEIGFSPRKTIEDAVTDLVAAFRDGKIPGPMTNPLYYNIRTVEENLDALCRGPVSVSAAV